MLSDTSPEVEKVWIEMWREKSPTYRVQKALRLTAQMRNLSYAGLKRARPDMTPAQINAWFLELLYGRELLEKVRDRLPKE
ncbi:MAG: hypothetical protein WD042_11855 [Phycisphaeraceae bacterium]